MGNSRPVSYLTTDAKILKEIMPAMCKKNHDQIKFNPRIQDWFEIMKSINVIYHIKGFKEKKKCIHTQLFQ